MKFEPNKYYKHSSGGMIHTLGFLNTSIYGNTLIAEESHSANFVPVGTSSDDHTQNYTEITEEEWLKQFSDKSDQPKFTVNTVEEICTNSPIGYRETNEIAEAWTTLKEACAKDYDYAWAIYCNLVMPVMDSTKVSHELANKAGVWLMRHLFAYDVTGLKRYHDIMKQYEKPETVGRESDAPDQPAEADSSSSLPGTLDDEGTVAGAGIAAKAIICGHNDRSKFPSGSIGHTHKRHTDGYHPIDRHHGTNVQPPKEE